MKRIFFTIVPLFCYILANAQGPIKTGTIKTANNTFECKEVNGLLVVQKQKSLQIETATKSKTLKRLSDYTYTKKDLLLSAFQQTFSPSRLKALLPEKGIHLTLYFNQAGKILDVSYILNKTSLITPQELDGLSSAIENTVIIQVPNNEKVEGNYAPMVQLVKFQRVLDKTL